MSNERKFLSDVSIIQKARDTKKLVIFVGAGVSINSDIPSWGTVLEKIKDDIGIDNNDTEDSLQIAQIYFNERKQKEYIEKIRNILFHKKKKYNLINEAIFDLQPEHVVTTNYDDLLEQVISNRALPFSVVKRDNDFPYSANSNLLVKIHGDLDDDDFILKEDDYLNYETDHPLFEAFIKYIFSTKVVVFVGYSFSDINLKIILQKVRNILGRNYQSSYLITHGLYSDFKVNYLREKGVNVLSYANNKEYIDKYLGGDNARSVIYKKEKTNLEKAGESLLDILIFIRFYNRFEEDLSKFNPIKQMSLSLKRYSELNTLPYFFIANLYPFNNKDEKIYDNEHGIYSLHVNNKDLIAFLKEHTDYNGVMTEINEGYLSVINNDKDVKAIKSDLEHVIKVLNHSAIAKMNHEYHEHPSVSVALYNSSSKGCKCFNCLLKELKLDELIDKLLITDITDASDLQDDANLAYAHYKCGNIYQSYNLFEEVAQKAWHAGKYILYFIAKYNHKRLGHILHWKEHKNLSETLIQEISSESDKIDLELIYRQINEVSKEEATLLRIIRDNQVLENAAGYLSSEYEKIEKTRVELDGGSRKTARNADRAIKFHLTTVDMFYNRNFIVNDVFSEHIGLFNTGIKAILINYTNYRDYSTESCSLDYSFCYWFIYYGNFDELKSIIKKYDIKEVYISEEDTDKLFNVIVNYYNSFVGGVGYFGNYEVNHKIYSQISKVSFDNKFVDIFDNISLLMGIIRFDKPKFDVILDHLISSLKYTDIFYPLNIINLEYFIRGNADYISSENATNILRLLVEKPNYFTKEILEYLSYVFIKKNEEEKISDKDLMIKVLNLLENDLGEVHSKSSVYLKDLYYLVNDEIRTLLLEKMNNRLNYSFLGNEYWTYVMNELVDGNIYFDKYVDYVIDNGLKYLGENFKYVLNGKMKIKPNIHYIFVDFIRLIYKFGSLRRSNHIDRFTKIESYMKFYFEPREFNPDDFKVEWLFCTYSSDVHMVLSKVEYVKRAFEDFIKKNGNADYFDLYVKYYL